MNKVCIMHIFKGFHGFKILNYKKNSLAVLPTSESSFSLSIVSIYHDVP